MGICIKEKEMASLLEHCYEAKTRDPTDFRHYYGEMSNYFSMLGNRPLAKVVWHEGCPKVLRRWRSIKELVEVRCPKVMPWIFGMLRAVRRWRMKKAKSLEACRRSSLRVAAHHGTRRFRGPLGAILSKVMTRTFGHGGRLKSGERWRRRHTKLVEYHYRRFPKGKKHVIRIGVSKSDYPT